MDQELACDLQRETKGFSEDSSPACSPIISDEKRCADDESLQNCERQHWIFRLFKVFKTNEQTQAENALDPWAQKVQSLEPGAKGYDQLAIFQASDRNFLQYRGFRTLHCRVMSDLQYQVEKLERELSRLDSIDRGEAESGERRLCSKRIDIQESKKTVAQITESDGTVRTRPDVLREIKTALLDYDEMLLTTKKMMALPRPAKRDHESMIHWFRGNEPIFRKEAEYIRRKEDIVTLRSGRESAGFDAFVERCLRRIDHVLQATIGWKLIQNVFLTEELRLKNAGEETKYFSPGRVDGLINVLITVVVFVLLILPVVIMYEVTNFGHGQTSLDAIGVLIVFTLIFGMAISCLTTARRHELFAASAAYAAVLVVFIGSFGVQQVTIQNPGGLGQITT